MAIWRDYLPAPYRLTTDALNHLEEAAADEEHYPVYFANDVKATVEALLSERDALQEALSIVCNGIPVDTELTLFRDTIPDAVKAHLDSYSLRFHKAGTP